MGCSEARSIRVAQSLLSLEMLGADHFIDKSAFQATDLLRLSRDGRGGVNLLVADRHAASVQIYVTLQLFLLSKLMRELPLVPGHSEPKLIFFFANAETYVQGLLGRLIEWRSSKF